MNELKPSLFDGVDDAVLAELTAKCHARERSFDKDDVIFHRGEIPGAIGILLSGSVYIENLDFTGNRHLLSRIAAGEIFAEAYALSDAPMMVDAVAAEACRVLFIDRVAFGMIGSSPYTALFSNLLRLCARKNLLLSERIFCTSAKSARDRILSYLSAEAIQRRSRHFTISFNRQEMADYLNLDRSALSKELGRMRDEGILTFRKNEFTLLRYEE